MARPRARQTDAHPAEQTGGDKLVRASQFVREVVARFYEIQRKSRGERAVVDLKFTPDDHYKYVVTISLGDWYATTKLPGDWVEREPTQDVIEALLNEAYAHIRAEEFAKGDNQDYTLEIVSNTTGDLNNEAAKLGYTFEGALATLRAAKELGRETTGRAKAKPRGKATLHWEANPELRAARLKATYEVLVRESDLANPKLSDEERLSRAGHIRLTYDRLRKLDPSFRDNTEQLRLARKLLNSRNYQRRKAAMLAV